MKNQKGPVLSEQSESNGFAPIIILVIVALAVGGYFAYQRGFLQKRYVDPTNSSTPSPSPSPTSTPAFTLNPKTGWKIYSRIADFTFQVPSDWSEQPNYSLQSSNKLMNIWVEGSVTEIHCSEQIATKKHTIDSHTLTLEYFKGLNNINCENEGGALIFVPLSIKTKNDYSISFTYTETNKNEAEKLFDQILSTFKFTN